MVKKVLEIHQITKKTCNFHENHTCSTAGTRRVALPRPLGEGILGLRAGSALSFVRWWLRASDTPARFFVWTAAPGGVASRHLHVPVVWMERPLPVKTKWGVKNEMRTFIRQNTKTYRSKFRVILKSHFLRFLCGQKRAIF